MIPPVEERQVRPCKRCVMFCSDFDSCDMERCSLKIPHFETRYYQMVEFCPCESHFTRKEMQELIDQHNYQNLPTSTNLVDGEIPGWMREIIQDRLQKLLTAPKKDKLPKTQLNVAEILLNWVLSLKREG